MVKTPQQNKTSDTTPASYPVTTPDYQQRGHDFTLQAVIEMQRSIGELGAKTDRLISDVRSQGDKIDSIRLRLAWVAGGAAVTGVIIGAIVTFATKWLPGNSAIPH